uniref:Uncharacterized protein n=1 Tax=Anguilla anguilla TaxID=7936 RepID=A0A0E9QFW6_ANGAN
MWSSSTIRMLLYWLLLVLLIALTQNPLLVLFNIILWEFCQEKCIIYLYNQVRLHI